MKARIDIKTLSKYKDLFIKAGKIAGFSTLTGFIIHVMIKESNKIIKNNTN